MKKQTGINLIELLLVLAIVLAIAIAAFVLYPRVLAARDANSSVKVLSAAQAQVKSIFPNGLYSNLNNQMAGNSGVFPDSWDIDPPNGVFMNDFANGVEGNIIIRGSDRFGQPVSGQAARFMTIVFEDIPSKVCIKLIPGLAGDWERVTVNGEVAIDKYDGDRTNDIPDEALIVTQCTVSNDVTVVITTR